MSGEPFSAKALMDFFESQGVRFVDVDSGEHLVSDDVSLCEECWCMTKTFNRDNTCMKCGAKKGEKNENNA